jgi:hypothetical protein
MKTVWKFPIFSGFGPAATVMMPAGAEIIALQRDGGDPMHYPAVWAVVDPEESLVQRWFLHVATGEEVPDDAVYIGTWQAAGADGSNLAFHTFEVLLA